MPSFLYSNKNYLINVTNNRYLYTCIMTETELEFLNICSLYVNSFTVYIFLLLFVLSAGHTIRHEHKRNI